MMAKDTGWNVLSFYIKVVENKKILTRSTDYKSTSLHNQNTCMDVVMKIYKILVS